MQRNNSQTKSSALPFFMNGIFEETHAQLFIGMNKGKILLY